MTKTVIKIMLDIPTSKPSRPEYKQPCLAEKVEKCCTAIEGNLIDSEREWKYIKRIYERLSRRKNLTDEQYDILDKIEPIIEKHNQYESNEESVLDAQYMHRSRDEDK